jgi:hypothetical protein
MILCNKKEAALRVSTRTMAPTGLQVNLELTAAGTRELPRWSVPSQLEDPLIIYKKKMNNKETKLTEETLIV